jgi:hypothetical protein
MVETNCFGGLREVLLDPRSGAIHQLHARVATTV